MAQRRSRNRRLSSSRRSSFGILADNTDIVDNDDPLWYNKSIIRPSTSFTMGKDATSVLNGDSTVNVSQMSNGWFENLTQSENSKIIQETVRKNINNRLTNEQNNAKFVEPSTESESEHESQKKRAKFKLSKKSKNNKTVDRSNAFLKALEKTTDSHTRNITNIHVSIVNDSESNTDDSRTIKKLRPRFVGNKKPSKEITNNFDDVLCSDSASERIEISSSMKRKSNINNMTSYTPEKVRKIEQQNSDIHSKSHYSINKTKDNTTTSPTEMLKNKSANKTLIETSRKSLHNRTVDSTIMNPPELNLQNEFTDTTITNSAKKESSTGSKLETPSKARTSTKLSQRKSTNGNKESDKSMNRSSNSIVNKLRKQRPLLLSQKNKSKTDENSFDAALESRNNSENKSTTHISTRISERNGLERNNEDEVHENAIQANASDNESSSIPKNIRRTRSYSTFNKNKSKDESEDIYGIQNETGTEKILNKEEMSKLQTTLTKNHENTLNISHTEKEKSKSIINEKSQRHSKKQTVGLTINNSKNISKLSNKSARNKTNNSLEAVKSVNGENIVNNSEESIEMENLELSKTESHKKLNKSNAAPHLSKRSKTSEIENGYDEVPFNENSVVNEISKINKNKTIEKSLKASQKSRLSRMLNNSKSLSKSTNNHSLNGSSNIKSTIWEKSHLGRQDENEEVDTRNSNEENENESESSSIPKHIRRTRSRLFQKSEYEENNKNHSNEILDVVNKSSSPEKSQTNVSLAQKSANPNLSMRNGDPFETEKNRKSAGPKITRIETISSKLYESIQSNAGNVSPDKGKTVKSLGNKSKTVLSSVNKSKSIRSSINKSKTTRNSSNKSESLRSSVNTTDETSKSLNNPKVPIVGADNGSIRSVETSSDGSAAVGSTEIKPATPPPRENLTHNSSGQFSDDLLYTPNPAQSTLIINGKPVTRITQFSFRNNSIIDEETVASTSISQSRSVLPRSLPPTEKGVPKKNVSTLKPHQEEEEGEDVEVDVMNNSDDMSQEHLISRRPEDIPPESEAEHSKSTKKSTAVSNNSKGKSGSQMKQISVRLKRFVMKDSSKNESLLKETSMGKDESALKETSMMNKSALKETSIGKDECALNETSMMSKSALKETSMMNKSAVNDSLTRKDKSTVKNSSVKKDKPALNNNSTRKDKSAVKNSSVKKMNNPPVKAISKKKLKSTQKNTLLKYLGAKSQSSEGSLDPSTMSEEDWAKLKKKTDAMKKKIEKRMDEEERLKQEEAQKKARLDAQLKRVLAQQEAERRRKQKKPIDPAYYVNGAVYKPPKLPRPKSWATDRLYRYLWKCLEPRYGQRTRVKSEQFVLKLADLAGKIEKRKKYANYSAELDELHRTMAKLNIIKTRYDFHRFCSSYMPYSFRIKAVPMMLPGNERNIPYDAKLVKKPILEDLDEDEGNSANSDSDSE